MQQARSLDCALLATRVSFHRLSEAKQKKKKIVLQKSKMLNKIKKYI